MKTRRALWPGLLACISTMAVMNKVENTVLNAVFGACNWCSALRRHATPRLSDTTVFEALGLTWDRVDRARGVIRLEVTKSGYRREVPLSANADAVLARRWSEGATGYVFGTKNWYAFESAWFAALRRATIEDFRFHDLRHTFASWLVQRGRSLKQVQDAVGHRTLTMTLRYSHLAPEHLRAAVAVLDGVRTTEPRVRAEQN